MLSLRKRVEAKSQERKKLSSKSHSENDLSSQSATAVTVGTDPRRVALQSGTDANGFSENDYTVNALDTSLSQFTLIFEKIKSPISQERLAAANELNTSLTSLTREVSVEEFQRFSNSLNNKIFELIHSSDPNEKIGGILAVDTLINFYSHTEELPNQTSRLANYLRVLIPSSDIDVMRLAANTIGKLAIPGGTLTSDFIDSEVKIALEWLTTSPDNIASSSKQEYSKHAALLLISALADNSPYLLYPYVNSILDNIWRALRDTKLVIRMDAALILGKCLTIIQNRDPSLTKQWFLKLFKGCARGLNLNTNEAIHATLLVYRELLTLKGSYLNGKFSEIYRSTIKYKDHKYDVIRKEVYAILPLLASFNTELFTKSYLDQVMVHYLGILKNTNSSAANTADKPAILVSIGDISSEVGSSIAPYVIPILDNVRDGLQTKYKHRKAFERELFYCIGKLTIAMGPALAKHINKGLLDQILSCSLSDYMQNTLLIIIERIPALEPTINLRLLDLLCMYLSGEKYSHPGSPTSLKPLSMEKARLWRNKVVMVKTGEINDDVKDAQLLSQALKMLQNINYKYSLTEFVRLITISYIEHENFHVRKLAALTSCDIFAKDTICKQTSFHALNSVSEVLSKLLTVAITDPIPDIRLEILQHLVPAFNSQLGQPDNLRLLFMAANDEMFAIEIEAVQIIGRLTTINPAYVVPSLRKTLLELLTQLKYSTMPRKKEESATMLYTLIHFGKDVTKPYIEPILDILLPKANDTSSAVASTALKAIGELAAVSGEDIKKYLPDLMPLIITTFQDQSNSFKRSAALKALGQLAVSAGYVIDPLLDYPELLGVLLNILKSESSQNIRRETVHLLGTLGALDPYKHREVEVASNSQNSVEQNAPPIDIALLMQGMSPSNEEYYPTVVINTLLKILHDPSLSSHHTAAVSYTHLES